MLLSLITMVSVDYSMLDCMVYLFVSIPEFSECVILRKFEK